MPKEKKHSVAKKAASPGPLTQKTLFDSGHSKRTPTPPPKDRELAAEGMVLPSADSEMSPIPPAKPLVVDITPLATASPPKKNSVGFAPVNTVVDAGDSLDTVRKQLAPVLTTTSKRKTTLFLKVRLPVDKKLKYPTSAAR
jgi:hypothetical protein